MNVENVKKYALGLHKLLILEYPYTKVTLSYQKTENSTFQNIYTNAAMDCFSNANIKKWRLHITPNKRKNHGKSKTQIIHNLTIQRERERERERERLKERHTCAHTHIRTHTALFRVNIFLIDFMQ